MSEQLDAVWMERAACKGTDTDAVFYPEIPHMSAGDEARAICAVCPVREQCLEYAIDNHEPDGIWGGKTWRQRRRLVTARRRELEEGPTPPRKVVAIRGPGGHFLGSKIIEEASE
jgi:WhiB family redox-sensing transcriptional regulator